MTVPRTGVTPVSGGDGVDPRLARLRFATREFEAIFLETLVREMSATTLADDDEVPLCGGEMYQGLAEEALGRELANARSVGIADLLYSQLARSVSGAEGAPEERALADRPLVTGGRPKRAENDSKRG